MKAAVVTFPGSNCDRDMAVALEACLGRPAVRVWHKDADFEAVDLIALPGGFSFGDYLRCGAMAAQSPVLREVKARAAKGVRVLAVCNGFQIAAEAGLLPGALLPNAGGKFVCRDVSLTVDNDASPFTRAFRRGDGIRIPVAHHDGNYFIDAEGLKRLNGDGRVAFRYAAGDNPNGSLDDIAGILNAAGTVLGMMPHPERAADPRLGGIDGRRMLDGLIAALS